MEEGKYILQVEYIVHLFDSDCHWHIGLERVNKLHCMDPLKKQLMEISTVMKLFIFPN